MKKCKIKHPRALWISVCAVIVLFALLFCFANIGVVNSSKSYIITQEQAAELDADLILVLGCKVHEDGSLSDALTDRVDTALKIYALDDNGFLMMSGDGSEGANNEPQAMKDYAVANGADPTRIQVDLNGFSTYESVYRMKYSFGANKVIIVTQDYHISRAVYLARAIGLDAYGVASENNNYTGKAINDIRESLARVAAVFAAIFKPNIL